MLEVFGAHFGPPAIVAVVICYMFAKRFRLYGKSADDHEHHDEESHEIGAEELQPAGTEEAH